MSTSLLTPFSSPTYSASAIPLSMLFVSPNNVRKVAPTGIEELAATIESQGLLHALHVTAEIVDSVPTGRYAVEAGGRRLVALQLLASRGRIDAARTVECRVVDASQALEISLIENVSQEAMHPADAFEAYQSLVSQGHSLEAVSAKFGVTVIRVQRRLKMANLAPELIALYRANEITLDHVMAFAATSDHERQLMVWNNLGIYNRSANCIKRLLCENEVVATDHRVNFVGLDVYVAAGGGLRTDLFSDEQTSFLTNTVLLDSLVTARIEQEAENARSQGWAWVDVLPSFGYAVRRDYTLPEKTYADETEQNSTDRLSLEAKLSEIDALRDDAQEEEDWDFIHDLDSQTTEIEAKIEAIHESCAIVTVHDKSVSGVVMCLERDKFLVLEGVIRKAEQQGSSSNSDGSTSVTSAVARPEVPEKLMLNLSSHRTLAIQALMLKNPNVALASLAHKMALSTFSQYSSGCTLKINLTPCRHTLERHASTLSGSLAATELDTAHQSWVGRLPKESKEWLSWFLSEPQATSLEMIVYGTAQSTDAIQTNLAHVDSAKTLSHALSLDMADWWTATPETYFDLVPKAKLTEALKDTVGVKAAEELEKMKKAEAVIHTTQQLEGRRWLPSALRERN